MKREVYWEKCETWNRPHFIGKPCEVCEKPMQEKDKISIAEVRVSIFRGDDEVHAMHRECSPNSKI